MKVQNIKAVCKNIKCKKILLFKFKDSYLYNFY